MSGKSALPATVAIDSFSRNFWRFLAIVFVVWSSYRLHPMQNSLDAVSFSGELHVVGVAGPTTFLPQGDAARGFQYELLREFADDLGVQLIIQTAPDAESVIRMVQRGEADIGITGLPSDDPRLVKLQASHPYLVASQQLVRRSDAETAQPDSARIAVSRNSAEAAALQAGTPAADIIQVRNATPEALLAQVNDGDADYAVVNQTDFEARRAAFPQLKAAAPVREVQLAWSLHRRDDKLLKFANAFLDQVRADGTLKRLASFYGQGETFNTLGVKNFQNDLQGRLPLYKKAFQKEAERHAMDWRLLAAIGYQESKWDAKAISPTGVEGLMMLTRATASDMGVANRGNPKESIRAGADYYQLIDKRIPDTVREPDRTWMTLAAYNMGLGHVLKARQLAEAAGDNPDQWLDVSRHLRKLPRAGQALVYVQEVRRYYDALLMTTPNDGWFASSGKTFRVIY
ncbi:membrane-bound lytic murein transglycosylase F [Fluviicoccus keumensis]|uniref:Membrane-bound lytic murein transglycosylase F n=1 Tax=Fluviicoccus keumensis TaxID=1435465 RepID=A0A4Q7ZBI5_9GAMM|nr:membrane-bound lytic murein transglycosylase MltF [Fluviicoccus keumensis]RZU47524.1 membrane-bound lytic murein transglycosylase F [Fluviicoccus keumensis]